MKIKLPFDCFVLIVIVIVVLLYHIYAWKSGQSLLHKASSLVSEPLFLC